MSNALEVSSNRITVGTLSFNQLGLFQFHYCPLWLEGMGFLLSPRLTPEILAGETAHSELHVFLSGLLPEGTPLADIAAAAQLSKSNTFGLLRYIGKETTGALRFAEGKEDIPNALLPVSNTEISRKIRDRDSAPFSIWNGKVRLSVAGLQDKIAVYVQDGDLYLADGQDYASTHILKPNPDRPGLECVVANEHFCMGLAAAAQLQVAQTFIRRVPEPVLLVERFDRQRSVAPCVKRIHIIDACQALGLGVGYKYERNFGNVVDVKHIREGVSFVKLFALIEKFVPKKAEAKLRLVRWCLFQYAIGNSDAHGKNVSFFMSRSGLSLAPAYDLLCISAHPQFEQEAAMSIGDNFDFNTLGDYDWALFAHECGIDRKIIAMEMKNMSKSLLAALQKPLSGVYLETEADFLHENIFPIIEFRAKKLADFAQGIMHVHASMLH